MELAHIINIALQLRTLTRSCAVQKAVLESTGKVGKKGVSPDSRRAMTLIETSTPDASQLVLQLVRGMVDQLEGVPTPPLIDSCMQAYSHSHDLELLSLVIPGMPQSQALQYAPVLAKLPPEVFKSTVKRLVTGVAGRRTPALTAQALLVLFHTANLAEYGVRCCLCCRCIWLMSTLFLLLATVVACITSVHVQSCNLKARQKPANNDTGTTFLLKAQHRAAHLALSSLTCRAM